MKRKTSGIVLALTLLLATAAAFADFCPPCPVGPTDDLTTSLGSFRVLVAPKWRAALTAAGYPGYNATSHRLQSPDLFDGSTKIGRSAQHNHGTVADLTGGVPVGTAGRMVSDASFALQPAGFQGPNGEHEVHTNVETLDMNLAGGPPYVKAGTAVSPFVLSPGEVESKPGGGLDFPAESFFDVFVEVGIPSMGISGWPALVVLKNNVPLLVQNADLADFPPRVVYIHGNSDAVPVVFRDANPGQWTAGEKFGDLVLAGHGLNFDSSASDVREFDSIMALQTEMPCNPPGIPTLTEWGLIVLIALTISALIWTVIRRKRTLATA
jgi:hypothetical protein